MVENLPVSVRFKPGVRAALVARAVELDRPVSWVVQRAVEAFLPEGALEVVVDAAPVPVAPVRSPLSVPSEAMRLVGARTGAAVECPEDGCSWVSPDRSSRCPAHDRRKLIPT